MKLSLAVISIGLALSVAHASTNTGQVVDIRSNLTSTGNTRLSILITGNGTNCSSNGWYYVEYPDTGTGAGAGKAWLATLLAALNSGRQVTIAGTGACDPYGLEGINYIDAL